MIYIHWTVLEFISWVFLAFLAKNSYNFLKVFILSQLPFTYIVTYSVLMPLIPFRCMSVGHNLGHSSGQWLFYNSNKSQIKTYLILWTFNLIERRLILYICLKYLKMHGKDVEKNKSWKELITEVIMYNSKFSNSFNYLV